MRFSFSKNKRIIHNKQFRAVLNRKLRYFNDLLILYIASNDCGYARLGVSVGRSFGNAVRRNRFKRYLREIFRKMQYDIPSGYDYLLMPSRKMTKKTELGTVEFTAEQLQNAFMTLVDSAKNDVR